MYRKYVANGGCAQVKAERYEGLADFNAVMSALIPSNFLRDNIEEPWKGK